jgi:hypothetical protein
LWELINREWLQDTVESGKEAVDDESEEERDLE